MRGAYPAPAIPLEGILHPANAHIWCCPPLVEQTAYVTLQAFTDSMAVDDGFLSVYTIRPTAIHTVQPYADNCRHQGESEYVLLLRRCNGNLKMYAR